MINLIDIMKKAVKKTKVAVKKVAKKVTKKVVKKAVVKSVVRADVVIPEVAVCHGCHGRGLINAETLCTECDGSGKA